MLWAGFVLFVVAMLALDLGVFHRSGLELDGQHQIPKLEYLLGAILAEKQDFAGALEHVRNYLRLSPDAGDADIAQKQAEQLERLSTSTTADK